MRKCHEEAEIIPENFSLYLSGYAAGDVGLSSVPVYVRAPNADQCQPIFGKWRDDGNHA